MATPRETLTARGELPNAATIAHEAGHTAVAYLQIGSTKRQKKDECYIVFRHRSKYEGASSYNPAQFSTPSELFTRHLAGIAVQARLCSASVADGLRTKLVGGTLFSAAGCLNEGSEAETEMRQNNAWSDWINIKAEAGRIAADPPARRNALIALHQQLNALCSAARFEAILEDLSADITAWLDEDEGDLNFMAIYPETRIATVFARHPA